MSRPATPAYTVPTWATTANYPGGGNPWNGQPSKVTFPDPATGFVPDQGAAAEYFNKLFNDAFTVDAATKTSLVGLFDYATGLALNYSAPVTITGTIQGQGAAYSNFQKAWITWGNNAGVMVRRSLDAGATWGATEITDGTRNAVDLAIQDSNGNMVVLLNDASVRTYTPVGLWSANLTPTGVPATPTWARLYNAPVSGTWILLGYDGAAFQIRTSTTPGTAWTARTVPGTFTTAFNLVPKCAIRPADDLVVCVALTSATTFRTMTSVDAGVTWTDKGTTTLATVNLGTGSKVHTLVWDATNNRFLLTVSWNNGVGSTKTDVYWSADGVAWTAIAAFTANAVYGVAPAGALLVALIGDASATSVGYSTDGGATWKTANFDLASTTPLNVVYGKEGAQVLLLSTTKVWPSLRAGALGRAVT